MDEGYQYQEKINLSHPPMGADTKEQDKRAYVMEETKRVIEEAVKEFREDKAIIEQAILDGRLANEPHTYSEVLTKRFGSEFTERFYGFSTMSKDVFKKKPPPKMSKVEPHVQHGVLANAMTAFTNLHMAHEICINDSYRLKAVEKIDTVESRVTEMMRKTFWSMVDEDMKQDPPVYKHALVVFEELREKLLSLLLPQNGAIRLRIEDNLNVEIIKKDIEKEEFDFEKCIAFIIDCLVKLCSSTREAQVESIKSLRKPSEIFSRIFDVVEIMKLDMTNFLISKYRPKIMEHCISYERQKFVEFLELEYDLTHDGLHSTREWLMRHKIEGRDTETTISKAFGEIITWNYQHPWPETLALDGMRLANIALVVKRSTIFGAMSLAVIELCKPLFVRNYYVIYNTLRMDLDKQFKILLPTKHMKDNDQINEDAKACGEEAVRVVGKQLQSFEAKDLPEDVANSLRQAVKDVLLPDNKIRSLLMRRIIQYVEESVFAESRYKVPLTSGLSSIKVEVELSATEFCKIVLHNRNAYNDIYCDIVEGKVPKTRFNTKRKDPVYLQYLYKLKMTHRSSNSMATEALAISGQGAEIKESKPAPTTQTTKGILKDGTSVLDFASSKNKVVSILPSQNLFIGEMDKDVLKILAPPLLGVSDLQSINPSVVPSINTLVQDSVNLALAASAQKTVNFTDINFKSGEKIIPIVPVEGKRSMSVDKKSSAVLVEGKRSTSVVKKMSVVSSKTGIRKSITSKRSVGSVEKLNGVEGIKKRSKGSIAQPSDGRKSILSLQEPEEDLQLPDVLFPTETMSSMYNCPGSPVNSWTPSASNVYSSMESGSLSSFSDISMDVHSNSQGADDLESDDDGDEPEIGLAPSESEHYIHYLKAMGKHPEPMNKTSPGDVPVSGRPYDTVNASERSFLDLGDSSILLEDRIPEEEIYHYAPQFLQNRTNPYLLSSSAPEYLRFAHPLLNKMVLEYEELMTYCNDPGRVCNPTHKLKGSVSWLDVEDIEGVNWKNHWILRKEAIYKHWRESRKDRKSSDQELIIDDEVLEAYAKAKAIAEAEEAKLKSAKEKVFDFLDKMEKEGLIQQKLDMEKAVDKSNKCPYKPKKDN